MLSQKIHFIRSSVTLFTTTFSRLFCVTYKLIVWRLSRFVTYTTTKGLISMRQKRQAPETLGVIESINVRRVETKFHINKLIRSRNLDMQLFMYSNCIVPSTSFNHYKFQLIIHNEFNRHIQHYKVRTTHINRLTECFKDCATDISDKLGCDVIQYKLWFFLINIIDSMCNTTSMFKGFGMHICNEWCDKHGCDLSRNWGCSGAFMDTRYLVLKMVIAFETALCMSLVGFEANEQARIIYHKYIERMEEERKIICEVFKISGVIGVCRDTSNTLDTDAVHIGRILEMGVNHMTRFHAIDLVKIEEAFAYCKNDQESMNNIVYNYVRRSCLLELDSIAKFMDNSIFTTTDAKSDLEITSSHVMYFKDEYIERDGDGEISMNTNQKKETRVQLRDIVNTMYCGTDKFARLLVICVANDYYTRFVCKSPFVCYVDNYVCIWVICLLMAYKYLYDTPLRSTKFYKRLYPGSDNYTEKEMFILITLEFQLRPRMSSRLREMLRIEQIMMKNISIKF